MSVNLRSFRQRVRIQKNVFKRFLSKVEKNPPKKLDAITPLIEAEVWQETECLTCANCCKRMTPTFTPKDISRISAHLGMSRKAFKEKWLYQEKKTGDWMNTSNPCQFLNLDDNKCSIYEVRPVDCAGFPHLSKKKMVDYIHVHKQNIEYCPATFKMVEKMLMMVKGKKHYGEPTPLVVPNNNTSL